MPELGIESAHSKWDDGLAFMMIEELEKECRKDWILVSGCGMGL